MSLKEIYETKMLIHKNLNEESLNNLHTMVHDSLTTDASVSVSDNMVFINYKEVPEDIEQEHNNVYNAISKWCSISEAHTLANIMPLNNSTYIVKL